MASGAVGVALAVAAVSVAAPAATASSAAFAFTCNFGLVGAQPVHVSVTTGWKAGSPLIGVLPAVPITESLTLSPDTVDGLQTTTAATISGALSLAADFVSPDGKVPVPVAAAFPRSPIPNSGEMTVTGSGTTSAISVSPQGSVIVNAATLSLNAIDAAGHVLTYPFWTSVPCTLDAGQSNVLATFGDVARNFAYGLTGSTMVKGGNGSAPLNGSIRGALGLDGSFAGNLALADTIGAFTVLGFLPVTAAIRFVQVGQTTGSLRDGALASSSQMNVMVPAVSVLGFPIGGGVNCGTSTPVTVTMKSTGSFSLASGGSIAGGYTLPTLTNCGVFTGLLSYFLAGPGNTVTARLTSLTPTPVPPTPPTPTPPPSPTPTVNPTPTLTPSPMPTFAWTVARATVNFSAPNVTVSGTGCTGALLHSDGAGVTVTVTSENVTSAPQPAVMNSADGSWSLSLKLPVPQSTINTGTGYDQIDATCIPNDPSLPGQHYPPITVQIFDTQPSPTPGPSRSPTPVAVTDSDNGSTVHLNPGEQVVVQLGGGNAGAGYWEFAPATPGAVLASGQQSFLPNPAGPGCSTASGPIPGVGCGTMSDTFTAMAPGTATITASRNACGEALPCTPSQSSFTLTVVVTP